MQIKKIMMSPVITCRVDDTLDRAAQLMWEHDIGAVPVVDHDGAIVGIVTDRDACMSAYTKGQGLHDVSVGSSMATRVYTCSERDSIDEVERLMSEQQIRRVPVVDAQKHPVGMVALNDIARYAASSPQNGSERMLTRMLANICEPRAGHAAP